MKSKGIVIKSKKSQNQILIKRIELEECCLSTKSPDNIVLLKNNDVLQITEIYSSNETNQLDKIYLKGKKLEVLQKISTIPVTLLI